MLANCITQSVTRTSYTLNSRIQERREETFFAEDSSFFPNLKCSIHSQTSITQQPIVIPINKITKGEFEITKRFHKCFLFMALFLKAV